jgi:uncharacterized protein YbbC (DUF1343 family)
MPLRAQKVVPGIDVLAAEGFARLATKRVGIVTNQTGRDIAGRRTIDLLANASGLRLSAIFSPEHGLSGDREGNIDSGHDARTGLPVYNLYGASKRPSSKSLGGLDEIVIDLQDVGARFYTYATTMAYVMEEAARARCKVLILDRPNPIGPAGVRGPIPAQTLRSFVNYFPMPVQHALTLGELALMFNSENHIDADLSIVRMHGYQRNIWYDETDLIWVNPSPNLRSLAEAILYPGVALLEGTNVSVGRGTATPFEFVGAPWIDAATLTYYLQDRRILGANFSPADFVPTNDKYTREHCCGVRIELADRATLDAPMLGIELAAALHRLYPDRFSLQEMLGMLGSHDVIAAIAAGEDPATIESGWQPALRAFNTMRSRYLLYPL